MSVLRTLLRASAFVAAAFAGLAHAQTTLTVTTTDMTFAVDGQCSLPEAFQAANTNATVNECVVGAGGEPFTIILGTNQTYVATAGVPDATVGPTAAIATVNMEIIGNGSTIRRDAAAPAFRLFAATTPGKALTLRDLILDNGAATDAVAVLGQYGGAVIGTGVLLQLDRVRVGGNTGGNASAVAAVSGILNVHRSSFVGNTGPVTLFVTDPTAIFNMANSTFDGNTTPGGGDVFVNGADAVNLRHNTIFGMVQIDNVTGASDFTGNLLGTGCASTGSPLLTGGSNAAPAGTCPVAAISDLTSVQPLGVYGGATLTRAIKLPSALADGNPDCTYRSSGIFNSLFTTATPITVDQRGFARPAGACDLGAFEAARFTPNTLPNAVVNQAYDSGAIQVDGSVPFTGLTASGLPAGLAAVGNPAVGQFNVTGTPTATGTFTATFTTQDNAGMVALHDMALAVIGPPGAPTITSSTLGNGQATIGFTPPGSDGGSPITGYQVKCNAGAFTSASSLTSPITINLPNGGTYDCQVYATNAAGEGPASGNLNFALPATTVTSILNSDAISNPGPSIRFAVTFSQAVTGVDTSDFTLTTTGVAGASITGITGSGTDYIVTVATGTGSGTIRLDLVDDDTIVDASTAPLGGTGAGNGNFNTGVTYNIVAVPGAPTITSITPGNGQATIAFTPPASDGGSPITGYRASCTPGPVVSASSATSPITIALANGATYSCVVIATNANGDGPPSAAQGVTLAATTVASIVRASANPSAGPSVSYTVTFTRAVTGVDAADFALTTTGVTGASITGVSGSGTTYTVTVGTGTGQGTIRLDVVDNDTITDGSAPLGGTGAGNGNFTSGEVYTISTVPGAPTITSITPGNGQATIAFTAPASDGGSPITGYRASCTPGPVVSASSATSPITIALANGATYSCVVIATNANGDGPPSAAQGVTLPATTVASIVRASANPNGGPSVGFTVTFSRAVTGVDAADFALTTTGVTGASITGVSGSGTTYTVTVATGTGQGTIRLDVVDNDTITDGSAPLGGTGAGNGNFTSGQVYTITSVPGAPTITSATPGSGQATIAFTAPASDGGSPITGYRVSCTPGPVVSASSATSPITITLANGTTYSCVVIATNANGDGPPSAPASVALGVTSVVSIVRAAANPTGAASVTFTVTFSQPVTGVDATDFAVNATGLTGAAVTGVSGSGTTYTVTVATGTGSGTLRLDLVDNDSINDGSAPLGGAGAGNGNFSSGESYTVDRTAPTVVSSNRVGAATVGGGAPQQFTVTFSEAVTGVDAADFAVTATGTAAATVTGVTGSGTTYTVTVNITTGGASGGTVRLDVNDNDSIVDALGNMLGGTGAGNGNFTTGQSYTVSSATTTTFSGSSATGSGTITVVATGGGASCTLQNPQFIPVEGHPRSPPAGSAPAGVVFPHGLFDFSMINCTPGSTVTLVITYPSSVVGLQYYKYGPTPGNTTPHWYVMPATAAANTMTFSITDGGLGDDDLTANGTIVDQGGPGTGTPGGAEPIPTMSEWMMILMGLMLFGMAAGRLRMRR